MGLKFAVLPGWRGFLEESASCHPIFSFDIASKLSCADSLHHLFGCVRHGIAADDGKT